MATTHATIAVVEDDAGVRTALQQLLRAAAFDTVTFASAEEFLEADGGAHVDCLIADVNLPGMNGVALLEALAADGGREVPAVLITGRDDPGTSELIRHAGPVPSLHKPFTDGALFDAIHAALRGV
ncbi:MAG: response regulator transcription factor [Gemmatimonadaceae bacterium]